jgi:hypothetical protein
MADKQYLDDNGNPVQQAQPAAPATPATPAQPAAKQYLDDNGEPTETPASALAAQQPPAQDGAPATPEQKGRLAKAWDWLNKGLISKDTFVGALTGMTPSQLDEALSSFPEETPGHAAIREFTRGALQDTADTASGFTSPIAIGTLAAGSAGKAPGALGKVARAVGTTAGVTFGAQGAKQAVKGGLDASKNGFTPENTRDILGGTGQAILGATAAHGGAKEAFDEHSNNFAKKVTNTGDARLAELKEFPDKAKAIHQKVADAESAAHAKASAAFPDFKQPIVLKPEVPAVPEHFEQGKGWVEATPAIPAETTTFRELQEQRSNISKDIANETQRVAAGQAPRFNLSEMYDARAKIDAQMNKAALEQGGAAGLQKLNDARAQFHEYMDDFHNRNSPLRAVLKADPTESGKIVGHFQKADTGVRALDALDKHGVDTNDIRQMLNQGDRPLKVTAQESAKLQKAGSDNNYRAQRIKEGLRQTEKNELPSAAQERLPKENLKPTAPGILKQIPGADSVVSPRALTRVRLNRALKNLGEFEPVEPDDNSTPPSSPPPAGGNGGGGKTVSIDSGRQPAPAEKTQNNASGESSASVEAQNRVKSEKAKGVQRVRIDTRSGKETPIANTVDAVDLVAGPNEKIVKRYADGREEVQSEGSPRQAAFRRAYRKLAAAQ